MQRLPPEDFTGDAESAEREAVLLTAETSLAQILQGHLPFDQAVADELMMLDARQQNSAALTAVWSRSWPVTGFSRLVCA